MLKHFSHVLVLPVESVAFDDVGNGILDLNSKDVGFSPKIKKLDWISAAQARQKNCKKYHAEIMMTFENASARFYTSRFPGGTKDSHHYSVFELPL